MSSDERASTELAGRTGRTDATRVREQSDVMTMDAERQAPVDMVSADAEAALRAYLRWAFFMGAPQAHESVFAAAYPRLREEHQIAQTRHGLATVVGAPAHSAVGHGI
jgi:hypothetical protein